MKVEVIKGVSHSVELILGEISVCINTDEAENLIAQLRAVVPVPSDVEKAAEITHDEGAKLADGYQHYLATGLTEGWERPIGPKWMMEFAKKRFIAGAQYERERLMKEKEIKSDNSFSLEYSNRCFRNGVEKGRQEMYSEMMKEAVEGEIVKDISGKLGVTAKVNLDGSKFGEKVNVIIIKKEK